MSAMFCHNQLCKRSAVQLEDHPIPRHFSSYTARMNAMGDRPYNYITKSLHLPN